MQGLGEFRLEGCGTDLCACAHAVLSQFSLPVGKHRFVDGPLPLAWHIEFQARVQLAD